MFATSRARCDYREESPFPFLGCSLHRKDLGGVFLCLGKGKQELGMLEFPSRPYHWFPSLVSIWKALLGGPCTVTGWTASPAQEEAHHLSTSLKAEAWW